MRMMRRSCSCAVYDTRHFCKQHKAGLGGAPRPGVKPSYVMRAYDGLADSVHLLTGGIDSID